MLTFSTHTKSSKLVKDGKKEDLFFVSSTITPKKEEFPQTRERRLERNYLKKD